MIVFYNSIFWSMNPDDLRMGTIIKDGADGDIIIVGSPFDYVRRRCINKGGESDGPCCLRRFFGRVGPIVNPEYGISIEKLNVTDYGNIRFKEEGETNDVPEACIEVITKEIFILLQKGGVPFVYGGSKESLLGSASAFHQKYGPTSQHILISGKPNLKKLLEESKLTSDNILTMLNKHYPHTVTLFGAHQQYFPINYPSHLFHNISYEKIREASFTPTTATYTQAGSVFNTLLQQSQGPIHVSLTVQAIQRFRGCRDVLSSGLTAEEIIEIFFVLGRCGKVKLVDISEFNHSMEDYQSSLLLVNLLYYFLLGWTSRTPAP